MARKSLVDEVADELLDRIVAGEFPPGSGVPGELELSARHEVSRMTVREAMKTLVARRILRVERGRGTFVNPLNQWSSLEAVLRAASEGQEDAAVAVQLIELRRMLETGAAELAASRITAEELTEMDGQLAQMRAAHEENDVDRFVAADLAFHDLILHASGNVFVAVLFEPLTRILASRRAQTSKVVQIQINAIAEHANIMDAMRSHDTERARLAMDRHMEQTLNDLLAYVLEP
ncbi:FadR/GntR family transcriptional regulator [Arthrobacter parietis]|uniref:FadR/GntR family transcriptional regulator n=2 Tax=Arthrobacter TaxID=1663 RepID=A0ABT6CTQ9_9MICC|nr:MULTISPECIES: FadR/GntR family transcriptional regulator [Arthrobacter]KRF08854.1 GntR family transcriptional regulator [Arthrobacter sp. Soil782]MDF9276897.1 FadR/GntR family transcriptional regulator [Arthrobacter vasquezii]